MMLSRVVLWSALLSASCLRLAADGGPIYDDKNAFIHMSGESKQWHKVTLTLEGPNAEENAPGVNPFTDLEFKVVFTHESGVPTYVVPGYFAADGDAANSGAHSGNRWRAHLSPDKAGRWRYQVGFRAGKNAALGESGETLKPFHGLSGSFHVMPTDKSAPDFRAAGRLAYVGKHHLRFAGNGEYFIKVGADSPETMLAFADFDGAVEGKAPLKTWSPHAGDWRIGDPTWRDGKGRNLIGALNYLSARGANAISFLTYNAGGDGDNVWPYVSKQQKTRFDCSKLDQWGAVFDHATKLGLFLHFKLQENESDDERVGMKRTLGKVPEALDGGRLGTERKLYCREIVARFGHALALNWNIGEENTQSTEEVLEMAAYLREVDPYDHPIVLHTFPAQLEQVYRPLLGKTSPLTGISIQAGWKSSHQRTLQWRKESAEAGHPWVVAHDEQNPAGLGVPPDPGYQGHSGVAEERNPPKGKAGEGFIAAEGYTLHDIRKHCLWGNLMAGGAGVEYYFGYKLPQNDLNCEDFRSRDQSWGYGRVALDIFRKERIPFQDMSSADALVGNPQGGQGAFCLYQQGSVYLVYLPDGGKTGLDLTSTEGTFELKWINPRDGETRPPGPGVCAGGRTIELQAPDQNDWLALLRRTTPSDNSRR